MKKYINISISVVLYIVAVVWAFTKGEALLYAHPWLAAGFTILLLLVGIILSVKSVNRKETTWVGRISIVIGLILLLLSIVALTMELSPLGGL